MMPAVVHSVPSKPKSVALSFEELTLGYDRHPAVHHLNGTVARGDLIALVGPNGAGKSTLLKGIIGDIKPLQGKLNRKGANPRDFAYLPQLKEIDRSFPLRLFDLVSMGLWHEIGGWRPLDTQLELRARQALDLVGLAGFEDRLIGSLSGGQLQRALFARLMLQNASIILLDEPFAAIDSRTVSDLIAIIQRWHEEGRTIIAAVHDLDQARANFPQTLLLARELVAWGDSAAVLTDDNLRRARHLCEAWDENAEVCQRGEHEAQRKS
ncbi:zinc/manganese transport system ATP-binding protein [Bradyrhizobium sp. USDA 4011]